MSNQKEVESAQKTVRDAEAALHVARTAVRDLVSKQKIERAALAGANLDFSSLYPRLSTAQLKRDFFAANNAKAIADIESGYSKPPERKAQTVIDQSSYRGGTAADHARSQMRNGGFRRGAYQHRGVFVGLPKQPGQ